MSFANPLSRLSSIIRAPVMVHTASSTESDWFLPYDGPIEPPPPPTRHPFAAELPQPKPVPATSAHARSKSSTAKSESRERTGRDRSRSRSRDAKRKSQRSYIALDAGGGVGAYPAPEREHKDREKERSSVQSDFTFGAHSAHTMGATSNHARSQGSLPHPGAIDLQYTFPPVDESTASTGGKSSDPPIVFANHPFRMHTGSPPPRGHTASASLSTPWVRTIATSPVPDPAPRRKRTLTYQPGLVSSFGSAAETRVGYRESGAFLDLDEREREKIRPTLLPPSLSLLGKASAEPDAHGVDEHGAVHKSVSSDSYLGLRGQYDMRSHPYAATTGPVRETRFGSVSTTTTTTTGGTGKPPVPPRPIGLKLKSSLKPSMSTPELRLHIPSSAPAAIPRQVSNQELSIPAGVGVGPRMPRSAGAASGSAAAATSASGGATGLEVRTICDALIFARPRFRAHEITPPPSPIAEEAGNRASVLVGESGLKGLACFPRTRSRNMDKEKEKEKEKERPGEDKFKTVAEVLRDGDQLEKEREEWNAMGQSSLLNSRTRSLSRSQSRVGGARVGGPKMRRETIGGNGESGWGTLKLKKSVEMLAATALSQGHGHAPSASVSSSHRRGRGTQGSVSTVSHARGASASVTSRAHSHADSWGQRVVCGSRSGSSLGDDGPGGHMGHSNIRPVPTGDTHRARAPPPPPPVNPGFGVAGPSGRPQTQRLSPGPNYAGLMPVQPPPSPGDSTIGLALSSPGGAALVLPNHPFSNRAGAHPAIEPPVLAGPETIATRHRHPPRSSGSTERARLDEPNHVLRPSRSAPPLPSTKALPPLQMKFPLGPGKSMPSPEHQPQHPFVTRPVMLSTASGEVQRMFESAMLRSVVTSSGREWDRRRGSGDSGLGSSVNDHGIEMHRAGGRKVSGSSALAGSSLRGSAFGPPGEFEEVEDAPAVEEEKAQEHERVAPGSSGLQPPAAGESEKAVSPMGSVQSPFSLMDSLAPSSRRGLSTRVSSGMIDPALAGTAISPMLSHESSSSSFSSPRPLASIDDIESLRGIFYRPSPVRNTSRLPSSQESSPRNEPVLDEESNESGDEEYGREITERYHDQEDWTFGRPLESQHDMQPLWERRRENHQQPDKTPLRIDLAPGTPSPTCATAPLPPAPIAATPIIPRSAPASSNSHSYQDVPESVHGSDTQSERSVCTTSSQRATNENLTFGFVRSAQVDLLGVNAESRPHSTALSLIDMYDYEASISSSSPNTPLNHQVAPYPFTHPTHDDSFLSPASAARPMDRVISGFPTPPADGTPMSSAVLSTYFNVDNQSSSRRSADERSCSR
ncbi:phosphatase [Ceratobasidium sp. AG-Ba]|nr:phosphatase [Ceratobasidium sp. AG-Ba]